MSGNLSLPKSIYRLIERGIRDVAPSKIMLFGSYARGDASVYSDFDIAFIFPKEKRGRWVRFLSAVEEEPLTLRKVDLVNYLEAPESLQCQINEEGVLLYENPEKSSELQ